MAHPVVHRRASVDRHARERSVAPFRGTGPTYDPVEILFVIIGDYGGHTPLEAATDLWAAAYAEHPGAVIHIIQPDDPGLSWYRGQPYYRGIELETMRQLGGRRTVRRAIR